MEKAPPYSYQGAPTAPADTNFPHGEYRPPLGGYPQGGLQHFDGLHQQAMYTSHLGHQPHLLKYPSQPGNQPQKGSHLQPELPAQPGFSIHQSPNAEPSATYESTKYGWWKDMQRNRPQSNSLAAATFIFISGGMSLAQSVGFVPDLRYPNQSSYTHMQLCWFVAVIIGAVISTFLIQRLTKRVFNFISAGLILLGGIIFISGSESVIGIAIGRYCDGIAFGLTLIPAIVAGSEQSVKQFRGIVLATEQIGLCTGFMIRIFIGQFWDNSWSVDPNKIHGILVLIYAITAIILTYVFTIESPAFYLNKDNETEALNSLRRLQRPQTCTTETYALLYENKRLLEEDNARGRAVNVSTGLMPMIKICLYRAFVSMSVALPLTEGLLIATITRENIVGPYMYPIMRAIGVLIAVFTLDRVGRKALTGCSLVIGGAFLIAVGALYSGILQSPVWYDDLGTVIILMLFYQIFAGLAAPASACYLGEAFSVSVKPYFILVAVIVENVVQIIICASFTITAGSIADFGCAVGVLQILLGVSFFLVMPETKQTTLREALAKFKKLLHIGL